MSEFEPYYLQRGRRVFVDMDGVLADFDEAYPRIFGHHHRTVDDSTMWKNIWSLPDYFLNLKVMDGAIEFMDDISRLDPVILTACPRSHYHNAAIQKRQWLRRTFPRYNFLMLPVNGGANKYLFLQNEHDILIDDYSKNIDPWIQSGGVGILHRSFEATREELLNTLLDKFDEDYDGS